MRRLVHPDFAPSARGEANVWTPTPKRRGTPMERGRALRCGFAGRSRRRPVHDPICPPRSLARSRRYGSEGVRSWPLLRAHRTAGRSAPAPAVRQASVAAIARCNAASAGVGLRHIRARYRAAKGRYRAYRRAQVRRSTNAYHGSSSAARSGQGGLSPSEQSKIVRAQTIVLPAMPRDYHASPQLPSAQPDEGTVRRRDVRAIEVIDECLGIELPYLTARLDRLPPPVEGRKSAMSRNTTYQAAGQPMGERTQRRSNHASVEH